MPGIHVVHEKTRNAARNAVTGKRGDVKPHPIARQPQEARIRLRPVPAMGELPAEAEV
jgi:hypothetical protein